MDNWMPPTAVGIGASVVSWLLSWRVNAARNEQNAVDTQKRLQELGESTQKRLLEFRELTDRSLTELKEDFRAGMNEIRALADAAARLQSSQAVVNTLNAKGLDSVISKQDQQADKLADHGSSLKLLMEMVPMLRQQCEDLRRRVESQNGVGK